MGLGVTLHTTEKRRLQSVRRNFFRKRRWETVGKEDGLPYGEYPYSIDEKGRVVIPPSFRQFVEDGMILTRGMEGCLYVFPLAGWRRVEEQLEGLPLTDRDSRAFVRFFYSGASKSTLDNQSRVSVPQTPACLRRSGRRGHRGGRAQPAGTLEPRTLGSGDTDRAGRPTAPGVAGKLHCLS